MSNKEQKQMLNIIQKSLKEKKLFLTSYHFRKFTHFIANKDNYQFFFTTGNGFHSNNITSCLSKKISAIIELLKNCENKSILVVAYNKEEKKYLLPYKNIPNLFFSAIKPEIFLKIQYCSFAKGKIMILERKILRNIYKEKYQKDNIVLYNDDLDYLKYKLV